MGLFFYFFYFTLQYCIGFAIHQHESATGYTCSQSWTPLPPPSPYHLSGSFQGAWVYFWALYLTPLVSISVFVSVPYCLEYRCLNLISRCFAVSAQLAFHWRHSQRRWLTNSLKGWTGNHRHCGEFCGEGTAQAKIQMCRKCDVLEQICVPWFVWYSYPHI